MTPHILIVDDTKALADTIADLLRMEGFQVSLVLNGESAIGFLNNNSPDLVITDLVMPGIDGIKLIEIIRSDPRHTHLPVILLTAQVDPENRSAGVKAGANVCLEKPFDEDDLLSSIQNLIKK
jgi:DNA-binding response OmpR family regulator